MGKNRNRAGKPKSPGQIAKAHRKNGDPYIPAADDDPYIRGPPTARVVQARKRLGKEGGPEQLLEELETALQEEPGSTLVDVDLAHNSGLAPRHFEALFDVVVANDARVMKWRFFNCPGFNDEAAEHLSALLSAATAEAAPTELHLSDCAVTTAGFLALMRAIEEGGVYPKESEESEESRPLFLRCERNFIDEAVIDEKVSAGIIKPTSTNGSQRESDPAVMVHIFSVGGGFAQKPGDPPDFEGVLEAGEEQEQEAAEEPVEEQDPAEQDLDEDPAEQEDLVEQEDPVEQDVLEGEEAADGDGNPAPKKKRTRRGGQRAGARKARGQQREQDQPQAAPPEAPRPSAPGRRQYPAAAARPEDRANRAFERFEARLEAAPAGHARPSFPPRDSRPTFAPQRPTIRAGRRPPSRSRTPPQAARRGVWQRARGRGGLPGTWQEHMSEMYGVPYYYNPETRETTWQRPT